MMIDTESVDPAVLIMLNKIARILLHAGVKKCPQ